MISDLPLPEPALNLIQRFLRHPVADVITAEKKKYDEMIYWYFDTFADWFPDYDEVYRWREMRNLRILIGNTQAQYDWASKWDVLDKLNERPLSHMRNLCSQSRQMVWGIAICMSDSEDEDD